MRLALIIGSDGQDGQLLFDQLSQSGMSIIGLGRGKVRTHLSQWDQPVDVESFASVQTLIQATRPDEIYFLAAYHHSSSDQRPTPLEEMNLSYRINVFALGHFLEAMRLHSPSSRLFYASSSLIFGSPTSEPQTEQTPTLPTTLYGQSKLAGMHLCRYYRQQLRVFASVGILYNHESHLRKDGFLSKKIIRSAIRIKRGQQQSLIVGNLDAKADWGYAPDFVDSFRRILTLNQPDDFIVATSQSHTVRDFVEAAFEHLNLDWKQFVSEDKALITRSLGSPRGSFEKLNSMTGWKPSVSFKEMIATLIEQESAKV